MPTPAAESDKPTRTPSTFGPALLHATVFVTGGGVMMLGVLGTRGIGPFHGVSFYVWSAVITVTLVALAAGYVVGGRFAESRRYRGLSAIISLAGICVLLISTLPWGFTA